MSEPAPNASHSPPASAAPARDRRLATASVLELLLVTIGFALAALAPTRGAAGPFLLGAAIVLTVTALGLAVRRRRRAAARDA